MSASAAPVLFLKLQDETFDVGQQFLMQVLTMGASLPVTWVRCREKAPMSKKKSVLPSCYHSQAQSYLPELFIFWTIFSSST